MTTEASPDLALEEDPAGASAAATKAAEAASEVIVAATEEAEPMRALPGVEVKTSSPKKISLLCSNEQRY
jgi:hypothetical protein